MWARRMNQTPGIDGGSFMSAAIKQTLHEDTMAGGGILFMSLLPCAVMTRSSPRGSVLTGGERAACGWGPLRPSLRKCQQRRCARRACDAGSEYMRRRFAETQLTRLSLYGFGGDAIDCWIFSHLTTNELRFLRIHLKRKKRIFLPFLQFFDT